MTQISFARGFPGPDLLPLEEFGECAKAALERDGATAMNYGPPLGYPPLREWIADRHDVPVECVMVTNGSLQAFDSSRRHHVQAGVKVSVEAPSYDRSLQILRRLGAEVEAVPLTDEGVDVDALDEALGRSSRAEPGLHDPDVPEPERPHALRAEPRGACSRWRARTARRCSRTIPTASSASPGSRCHG